jgi:hypothetical protein
MKHTRRLGISPAWFVIFCNCVLVVGERLCADTPVASDSSPQIDFVSTGKQYRLARAAVGERTCIDRAFEIREISAGLRDGWLLQTANDDDFVDVAEHVRLSLRTPARVYVCYDSRSQSPPAWLRDWTLTDEHVVTTDVTSRVYRRNFRAGVVKLGGNQRRATGGLSHYFAIILPITEGTEPDTPAPSAPRVDFARQIAPLLAKNCNECHGADLQEGGLRLDVRRRALLGGDTGITIHPGDADASLLITRVTTNDDELRMPQGGEPLAPEEVKVLRDWIDQGALWPDELAGREDYSDHWSYRAITRPAMPDVARRHEMRNPIDAFVLAKLEPHQIGLSPESGRAALLRRLHLDLVGLPPSIAEVQQFVNDDHPDAYAQWVDRLLDSPHFGERWGRHWLDLARFAETDGYENDRLRPEAWRFRDWVIEAVNRDQPYDQFTVEQLAGDLLAEPTLSQQLATGFHRNTLWNSAASADKEEFRIRAVKDRAETTATVWLGMTLACAQCHSHKYDPIAQREYYQFYAFFNAADETEVPVDGGKILAMKRVDRSSRVHRRGNFLDQGDAVRPTTPAFLPMLATSSSTPDRLDLARWIVDRRNPLTARVAANHIWQHLFGRGLVGTPENFGRNGEPPSHPELLDWLASELVDEGWSRKRLIRTIVLSATYRQGSDVHDDVTPDDPENRLLSRQNRFRVEAEIVRDLALAVSGLLDRRRGGPSVVPPFPDGLLSHKLTAEELRHPTNDHRRRSVYVHVQRTLLHPSLAAFDAADGNSTCVRRERSSTPVQALALLNDPVFTECIDALGEQLRKLEGDESARLRNGFARCLSRQPTDDELNVLRKLVERQREQGASDETIWRGVARTLINLDEFTTRE